MPIVDIELVADRTAAAPATASTLADAIGAALGCDSGRAWVRLRHLDPTCYAENGAPVDPGARPVFVTVLHAHPPEGDARRAEVLVLTRAVARVLSHPEDRVHVQYAPAAAGRQAFGGRLVD